MEVHNRLTNIRKGRHFLILEFNPNNEEIVTYKNFVKLNKTHLKQTLEMNKYTEYAQYVIKQHNKQSTAVQMLCKTGQASTLVY